MVHLLLLMFCVIISIIQILSIQNKKTINVIDHFCQLCYVYITSRAIFGSLWVSMCNVCWNFEMQNKDILVAKYIYIILHDETKKLHNAFFFKSMNISRIVFKRWSYWNLPFRSKGSLFFYLFSSFLGANPLLVGEYENLAYSGSNKNNYHYATITYDSSNSVYLWKNRENRV